MVDDFEDYDDPPLYPTGHLARMSIEQLEREAARQADHQGALGDAEQIDDRAVERTEARCRMVENELKRRAVVVAPIPMVLFCPHCGTQHVDAPSEGWDNPPHKSHLCHSCGCIWRPADVTTVGVAKINTRGGADNLDAASAGWGACPPATMAHPDILALQDHLVATFGDPVSASVVEVADMLIGKGWRLPPRAKAPGGV